MAVRIATEDDLVTERGRIDGLVTQSATLVPGNVYENDGVTVSTTKRLHIVLTADGTDIDDLIIETVA